MRTIEATSQQTNTEAGEGSYLDPSLWARLAQSTTAENFVSAWLDLQCRLIPGVEAAVVVQGPVDEGPFAPVAFWPAETESQLQQQATPWSQELGAVAETALEVRRGVARSARVASPSRPHGSEAVAYPIMVDERLHGVVAIEVRKSPNYSVEAAMRQLQWGSAWLEALIRRHGLAPRDHLVTVLDFVAICMEHDGFKGGARALVSELAPSLDCDRVSIGFRPISGAQGAKQHVKVEVLSHSADFGEKSNLMRAIGAAMDEAMDQQDPVVYPPLDDDLPQITRAHAELARQQQADLYICTVPLSSRGVLIGAMTLERQTEPFDAQTVELCSQISVVVGPLLDILRKEERWIGAKLAASFVGQLRRVFGAGHLKTKLLSLLLLALIVFFAVAKAPYRVTADATLEGAVQRVVTASQDGFIRSALRRAGDEVKAGELLATLDDRDLKLEQLRWRSQKEQHDREHTQALAAHEWDKVRILDAQTKQAQAQLALLGEQLQRTKLAAPFDGVVVSGDLSQKLGSPVSRGEVLFEVAPLSDYRIILSVDERDISRLQVSQRGRLALAGMPNRKLEFTVKKITPVSATQDGRNFFRVEATLDKRAGHLRPGMEGIAKVDIDRRLLIDIWTYRAITWVRLQLWTWFS